MAKKVLCLLLIVCSFVCVLASCGGETDFVGKYEFYSMKTGDLEYKVGDDMGAGITVTADLITLELFEDNTAKMTSSGVSSDMTWKVVDGNCVLADKDGKNEVTTTFADGLLTIAEAESEIVLKKV